MKRIIGVPVAFIVMMLLLASIFAGCSGATGENASTQNTTISGEGNSPDSFEIGQMNPSDYVDLGDYEGIEIIADGLSVSVGEEFVNVPYRDETFGTQWTLQYYYSQVNPTEDKANWEIPTNEDVAGMGIPGITTFLDLKDYVCQKLNENDEITTFMLIGDAVMEQVAANSAYGEIPEAVILACESIYTDYLEKMLARYNEIGEIPFLQKDESSAYKVLAAMAIAQETGIGTDEFDYEKVLKYLVEQ